MPALYSTAQDVLHHFSGWTLSDSLTDIGPVTNEGEASCAEAAAASWEYLDTAAGHCRCAQPWSGPRCGTIKPGLVG